tara:strand:+ start:371 stop:559 length:189 start_codon:yes stop_codon:yes gene_type:complete
MIKNVKYYPKLNESDSGEKNVVIITFENSDEIVSVIEGSNNRHWHLVVEWVAEGNTIESADE